MSVTSNEFQDLPEVYCRAWADRDPSELLKLFADDSVMTDHGAQIHVPRNFLERHHKHWNGAHEDFEVYLEYDCNPPPSSILVYSQFGRVGKSAQEAVAAGTRTSGPLPKYPIYWSGLDGNGNGFCSFRTINKGVFVNDLGRRKATGLPFHYSGVIDLELKGGKITKADEWLRVPFEDSVAAEDYIVISDESLKKVMRKDLHQEVSA